MDEYAESAITCHVWMCWQAGSCMNVWHDGFIQRTRLLATLAISLLGRWTSFLQHHILCRCFVLVAEKKTMLPAAHHWLWCLLLSTWVGLRSRTMPEVCLVVLAMAVFWQKHPCGETKRATVRLFRSFCLDYCSFIPQVKKYYARASCYVPGLSFSASLS